LSLAAEPGTSVVLSYRGDAFSRAKPANRTRVETERAQGKLRVLLGSTVTEVRPGVSLVKTATGIEEIPSDHVIVCVGGVLPIAFPRDRDRDGDEAWHAASLVRASKRSSPPSHSRALASRPQTSQRTRVRRRACAISPAPLRCGPSSPTPEITTRSTSWAHSTARAAA
jgi:hypothetical protein